MEDNFFVFTEIVNCGKIGRIAIDSFHKYHNQVVHVYGTKTDFDWISPNCNNIFIEVTDDIARGFEKGHIGTALLWEEVIKSCKSDYILHFDSDVIFRDNILDSMIEKSVEYDIIGPIRNYHHNPNDRNDIRFLTNICQTNLILFNKSKISFKYLNPKCKNVNQIKDLILSLTLRDIIKFRKTFFKKKILKRKGEMSVFAQMIHGYSPFIFNCIDFFDPVMFDMVINGARIFHLDSDEVGGCDKYGKRDNEFREINNFSTPYKIDFGSKLVHFSCVGSGMMYFNSKEKIKNVPQTYIDCAIDRYALFCKIFYDENIDEIDLIEYDDIINIKKWY